MYAFPSKMKNRRFARRFVEEGWSGVGERDLFRLLLVLISPASLVSCPGCGESDEGAGRVVDQLLRCPSDFDSK